MGSIDRNSFFTIIHDGVPHHPLGSGSYYFRNDIVKWLIKNTTHETVNLSIAAQPNSSPHIGNIITFALAFALATELKAAGKTVSVYLDMVDTAPTPDMSTSIDGVVYQRSLRFTGLAHQHLRDFNHIMTTLSATSQVPFVVRSQSNVLSSQWAVQTVQQLVAKRAALEKLYVTDSNHGFGLRAACPVPDCGLIDKAGKCNLYLEDRIVFRCPSHGIFTLRLDDAADVSRLELNTPLRILLRNCLFHSDTTSSWITVQGSDYAGFYQEQFLWRALTTISSDAVPLIMYSPLVLDWSGAKLSKSLYVKKSAYRYLEGSGLEYLLDYGLLRSKHLALQAVYRLCLDWVVHDPGMLFRPFSMHYLHDLIESKRQKLMEHDARMGDKIRTGTEFSEEQRCHL